MDASWCILIPMVFSFSCENLQRNQTLYPENPSWHLSFLFKRLHRCYKPRFTPRHPSSQSRECSLSSVVFQTRFVGLKFVGANSRPLSFWYLPRRGLTYTSDSCETLSREQLSSPVALCVSCFQMGVCAACTVCTVQLCVSAVHV